MKVLKVLLVIVAIVIAVVVVLGLMAPKEFSMSRDIEVNSTRETVWKSIGTMEAHREWSPWAEKDADMKYEFQGTPGTPGSMYSWSGNDQVGQGEQEIVSANPTSDIKMRMRMIKPWEFEADVTISTKDMENGQKVTWSFYRELGFIPSIFMMLSDLEGMLAPDFEKGLANLKKVCESTPQAPAPEEALTIEVDGQMVAEKEFGPKYYVGVRQVVKWDDLQRFLNDNFDKTIASINDVGFVVAGPPSALYYKWDEENQTADMAAVIPVDGQGVIIDGYDNFDFEFSMSYQVDFYGSYEETPKAHGALEAHMANTDMELSRGMVVEEYVTGPTTETDQSKWLTRVIYPVRTTGSME